MLFPVLVGIAAASSASPAESICYGTTSNGRLENGCALPYEGANFTGYSWLGSTIGRTHVHCRVAEVVLAAYEELQREYPDKVFVYGETGWPSGGSFKPHKTHQNGLSVDFMTPVVNGAGESVPLPAHVFNRYGYDVEFDTRGRTDELSIDFEAVAAHLLALKRAADSRQVRIWRVIFDPGLQPFLRGTKAWPHLDGRLEFSKRRSWVRHDDHYHVDFDLPCRPLT